MAKYKVELNNPDNLRQLLQEAYVLSNQQITQAQDEMNKLANATKLQEEVMDAKQKYAKAMNDYLSIKDKAIKAKIDIAKLMAEVMTHNGDSNEVVNSTSGSFDLKKIREMVNESYNDDGNDAKSKNKVIELK